MRGSFRTTVAIYVLCIWIAYPVQGIEPSIQPTTSPASLEDAIDAFSHAAKLKDAAAMSSFYYAEKSSDHRLELANANRVLACAAFTEAGKAHLPPNDAQGHGLGFKLSNEDLDFPKMYYVHENGDEAALTLNGPEQQSEWLKRIKGAWKLDITPNPPLTIAEAAQDMEENSAAINLITDRIKRGELKTWRQVRDALGEAMLNADIVPEQLMDDVIPAEHTRAGPHNQFSTDPTTPAGAMNRFVEALKKSDEAALTDGFFMPTDKTGEYRAAAAHDWVTGMHLLLAAESKFPVQDDSDRIGHWLGGVQSFEIRGYTDDEWMIARDEPGLAVSSNAVIPATEITNGKTFNVMRMAGAPLMHRCADGHWRLGPRFPKHVRKLKRIARLFEAKDKILDQAAIDIRSGKYKTDSQAVNTVAPQLQKLGPSWNLVY